MRALASLFLLTCLGCARTTNAAKETSDAPPGGLLITEERIEKSGAKTAWEVLKREAPIMTFREDRAGRPTTIRRRGQASFFLNEAPVIILDGVRVPDFRALQSLPAETLFSIYVLTGIEGTTYYGTNAAGGVIVIRTKNGS